MKESTSTSTSSTSKSMPTSMPPCKPRNSTNPITKGSIFLRRLGALCYDMLLLLAIFMIGSLFIVWLNRGAPIPPQNHYYQTFLFLLAFSFFVGFWSYGGQTTGMRAWRLQLLMKKDGKPPTLSQASLRFFLCLITQCCGGLGWLWIFLDPDRQTLYDRLAGTELIMTL